MLLAACMAPDKNKENTAVLFTESMTKLVIQEMEI